MITVPDSAGLFIVDSGVERSLENTAYARASSRARARDAVVGAERSTEVDASALDGLDDVSRTRRLRHVVSENERVRQFAPALEAADLAAAGRLLGESHASLRDDYEVSIPSSTCSSRQAESAGAHGARLLGGGFGGAVLVLTDADDADAVALPYGGGYRRETGRDTRPVSYDVAGARDCREAGCPRRSHD